MLVAVLALMGHLETSMARAQGKKKGRKDRRVKPVIDAGKWIWAQNDGGGLGPPFCERNNCNDLCADAQLTCDENSEMEMSSIDSVESFLLGPFRAEGVNGNAVNCVNIVPIDETTVATGVTPLAAPTVCYYHPDQVPSTCDAMYEAGATCRICFCSDKTQ